MKKFKKLFALFLSLAMLFSLTAGFNALADGSETESYTITISNAVSGETYSAYKIFDVSYAKSSSDSSANDLYSYTILSSSPWYSAVSSYASTENNGLSLTAAVTASAAEGKETVYVVTFTDAFSPSDFAKALSDALSSSSIKPDGTSSSSSGTASISLDSPGYYLVTCDGEAHALCELTTTDPTAKIYDKNTLTFTKGQAESKDGTYQDFDLSVNKGSTVYFKIYSEVPDTTGMSNFEFTISDTLASGLSLDSSSITVTVNGAEVYPSSSSSNPSVEVDKSGASFTVTFTDFAEYNVGDKIEVSYYATVTGDYGVYKNSAELYWQEMTWKAYTDTVNLGLGIFKASQGSADTPLSGASFIIKRDGKYYRIVNGKVSFVDEQADATVLTSGTDGEITFNGLTPGEYEIIEVSAPTGYNLLTGPVSLTVDTSGNAYIMTATVYNASGSLLPSTGGMGTRLLYTIGALLISFAGLLLILNRKKGEV